MLLRTQSTRLVLMSKGGNTFSQDHERLVDLDRFALCLLVEVPHEGYLFAAGQIHQEHLALRQWRCGVPWTPQKGIFCHLLDLDAEDAVRAT